MGRPDRRVRKGLAGFALAILVAACVSPTLPLPPPALPSITNQGVAAGSVLLASQMGAEPNALVIVINNNPTVAKPDNITQADDQGSWQLVVEASTGDYLEIYQLVGTSTGTPIDVQVPMF